MKNLTLAIILLSASCLCCQSSRIAQNNIASGDSTIYKFVKTDSGSFFSARTDTTWFSKSQSNEKTNFSKLKLENGKILIISLNRDATICFIQETLQSPSIGLYLDLPYGQFGIDKSEYSDKDVKCTVIINKQPNKDEKKLTKADWKKAEKRRKEVINFLDIVDTESKTLYASASRVTSSTGEVLYAVKISDQCPEKSRILFKSALFMILWIYLDQSGVRYH